MTGDLELEVRAALAPVMRNQWDPGLPTIVENAVVPVVVRLIEAHRAPLPLAALDAEARRIVVDASARAEKAERQAAAVRELLSDGANTLHQISGKEFGEEIRAILDGTD